MAAGPHPKLPLWPLAMLALVLCLQAAMVISRAVNWDEFYHYSQVQKLAAGTLSEPLQSLYTRAFVWVTRLPGSGIDHIVTIRWFMLACELATLAAIIGIASRFASRSAAWLCALGYAGAGYVLQHATAFRFDGPAAALLMSAAWLLLRARLGPLAIAAIAVLAGMALVLTIKALLYAPVFAGIAWLRWQTCGRSKTITLRLGAVALATLAASAAIYWLHASTLPGNADGEARAILGRAGDKMFSLGIQPYWPHHLKGAATAPVLTILLIAFPWVLARVKRPAAERVALIGLVLPLTTLLFYHNTAPYYFVFMLAPVCAALGLVLDQALARYSEALIALVLAGLALAVWATEPQSPLARQRQLLAAADTLFPDRPAYFDACALLGTFPKANTFMTPMGVLLYRQGSYPSLAETMARQPVPLVVADSPFFAAALQSRAPVPEFLPQDLAILRDTYVHLWGPFWVAGRDLSGATQFKLQVPGRYRVERGDVVLDGQLHRAGAIVTLLRGVHTAAPAGQATVRLIWAETGPVPIMPPPAQPWFADF